MVEHVRSESPSYWRQTRLAEACEFIGVPAHNRPFAPYVEQVPTIANTKKSPAPGGATKEVQLQMTAENGSTMQRKSVSCSGHFPTDFVGNFYNLE